MEKLQKNVAREGESHATKRSAAGKQGRCDQNTQSYPFISLKFRGYGTLILLLTKSSKTTVHTAFQVESIEATKEAFLDFKFDNSTHDNSQYHFQCHWIFFIVDRNWSRRSSSSSTCHVKLVYVGDTSQLSVVNVN